MKEHVIRKKHRTYESEETEAIFYTFFENLNINAQLLEGKELKKYRKQWVNIFTPPDADPNRVEELCLSSYRYSSFLWHLFSYEILHCEAGAKAKALFDLEWKGSCVMINNADGFAYRLENAENITAELLDQFVDITITAQDFSWTYAKTHEETCGPYFYKK